jgi:hypothetical protein
VSKAYETGASQKSIQIARELKRNGVSIGVIAVPTELTKAQIEKL